MDNPIRLIQLQSAEVTRCCGLYVNVNHISTVQPWVEKDKEQGTKISLLNGTKHLVKNKLVDVLETITSKETNNG